MDAPQLVIQQLEGLLVEVDALAGFLHVLDDAYVSAEPAGEQSIKFIFSEILRKDHEFLRRSSGGDNSGKQEDLDQLPEDFEVLLGQVRETRLTLVTHLKSLANLDGMIEMSDGQELSHLDYAKALSVSTARSLRQIGYRIHGSQKIFEKSDPDKKK